MDMKRILQAIDGAATKPVAGAKDMSKFLSIVSEAEQIPAMPDISGLQPGSSKDLGDGTKVEVNPDGTVSYSGAWGTYVYNAQGQHISTKSPSFAGYSQETDTAGNVTQQNYQQGPLSLQKGPDGTTANYQLGAQNLQTQVQENDLSKFLSIIEKNDVQILNEGSNPHKVSLPVQMAMQHYQQPVEKKVKQPSLLAKYFTEAEEAIQQEQEDKKQLMRQYASVIAERVLMKESKLKDKNDLIAKRKALQDIQMDPHTHKDPELKAELIRRKSDLEKEAKAMKLDEHEAGWNRVGMAGVGLQSNEPVEESPIAMDPTDPNNPMIHSHEKANPMSLKSRITQARGQLKELAALADANDLASWERICKLAKGGMFMGLEQNLEQIRHGIAELADKRKKGGVASRGIDKSIGEAVLPKIKATTPKAIKPKAKTSVCRAGQVQTGMQTKDGKTVPKCSVK